MPVIEILFSEGGNESTLALGPHGGAQVTRSAEEGGCALDYLPIVGSKIYVNDF
jgi:hypothetical protein